jgi:hypothetical protein
MFALIVKQQVIDPDDQQVLWFSITERIFKKLEDAMRNYNKITPKVYQMPEFVSNRNGYKFIIDQETNKVIKDEDFVIPVGPIGPELTFHTPVLYRRKGEYVGYRCLDLQSELLENTPPNGVSASDEGAQQP